MGWQNWQDLWAQSNSVFVCVVGHFLLFVFCGGGQLGILEGSLLGLLLFIICPSVT